jgi:hypothetical protein
MALDSYIYGDPCKVLEQKQEAAARKERACGQCIHRLTMPLKNEVYVFCEFKRKSYGKRCELYATDKK